MVGIPASVLSHLLLRGAHGGSDIPRADAREQCDCTLINNGNRKLGQVENYRTCYRGTYLLKSR